MKRGITVFMVLAFAAGAAWFLSGCEEEAVGTGMNIPEPEEEILEEFDPELANASNRFGFEMFRELVKEEEGDENVFISPTSIYTALAMTYNGARGETREAMEEVLGIEGVDRERFNENNLARLYQLQEADEEVVVNIANSLWMREEMEFDPDFVGKNENYYHASARELDFDSEEAVDIINGWVEESTDGLIEDMVEHPIDPMTVLFLINAVYFQGEWSEPFDPELTEEDVFYGPEGEIIEDVPYMHLSDDFSYLEEEKEFQAVRLPYGEEERLAMYIFLPHEESSLTGLVEDLADGRWDSWIKEFRTMEGDLALPRFSMEYEKTLDELLKQMGMEVAFDSSRADFFDMIPRDEGLNLFISEVKHKSFIEVDEEGTEAAAATSVEVELESAPVDYFHMEMNRPFLFLIHDRETNEVLFTGTVADPSEQ